MKQVYIVTLNLNGRTITTPWVFTTMKKAAEYGEYKFRTGNYNSYRIETLLPNPEFHKLTSILYK